jgi:hypothetical protein
LSPCAKSFDYCATQHELVETLLDRFKRHVAVNRYADAWPLIEPFLNKAIQDQLLPALRALLCEDRPGYTHKLRRGHPHLKSDPITTKDNDLLPALGSVSDCTLSNLNPGYSDKVRRKKVTNCLIEIINFQRETNLLRLYR